MWLASHRAQIPKRRKQHDRDNRNPNLEKAMSNPHIYMQVAATKLLPSQLRKKSPPKLSTAINKPRSHGLVILEAGNSASTSRHQRTTRQLSATAFARRCSRSTTEHPANDRRVYPEIRSRRPASDRHPAIAGYGNSPCQGRWLSAPHAVDAGQTRLVRVHAEGVDGPEKGCLSHTKPNGAELQFSAVSHTVISLTIGVLLVDKQGGRAIGVYMSATALEVNAESAARDGADDELHPLWVNLWKVIEQISSAAGYSDQGSQELARCAALEGVTSLRLGFSKWIDGPTYREIAAQERQAYAVGEPPLGGDGSIDKAILRLCVRCAQEIEDCVAIPMRAREQLVERLREVSAYGADGVVALAAQAAVVERALKAKAR